jgi:hypothetical protein
MSALRTTASPKGGLWLRVGRQGVAVSVAGDQPRDQVEVGHIIVPEGQHRGRGLDQRPVAGRQRCFVSLLRLDQLDGIEMAGHIARPDDERGLRSGALPA